MRRLLLLVVVAAIGFASCQRDDIQGRRAPKGITTVSASHEQPETRLSIDVDHEGSGVDQALWRAGDKLYLYEQTFTDLSGETPDKSYYSLALADATTTVAPIVFDIKSGAGSKTALFELNNSEERGLNSDKSYVAIHTNGTVGGAGDVVRTAVAGGVGSLVVGGGLSVTSTGTGEELCEDQTVLYSQVLFDGNGMVAPLTFIHTTQTILEFDIKLQDAGQGATKLSYIKLMAHRLTNLSDTTVGTPMHAFADAQSLLFDANKALRAEPLANAPDGALFAFTTTGDVALSAETSTRVRIPINWTGSAKGLSNKRVRVEIGMKVNATGTEEAAVSAHYFDKPAAAERPTFEIGKTYVKAITAAPLLLSDDILPFIPDANFRAYCAWYDTDGDSKLTPAEAQAVTIMDIVGGNIASLDGIEHFTGLTELNCGYNQLTSLDVSKNTELTYLDCSGNQLTSLDVTKNTKLTHLGCFANQLTSLDVSKNTELTYLDCFRNKLTSLDVTKNKALTELYCFTNPLTSLDLSKNTALKVLYCDGNQLASLDVTKNTKLTTFDCARNQFKSLDLSKNTALEVLSCSTNQLTSLDVSNNTALTHLYCTTNQLTTLDLSNNTKLNKLDCRNNPSLTKIFVWGDFDLETPTNSIENIYKDDHSLFKLFLDDIFPFITDANFKAACAQYDTNGDSKLTSTEAQAVTIMNVSGKSIASLAGIEHFTGITELDCHNNQLTSLDVSKNTELTYLVCSGNQLTSLDVSKNTKLIHIGCFTNQLTSLDVSNNTALTWLGCSANQLTSLDVSKSTALAELYCFTNPLTSLDVTKNKALTHLGCSDNQLTGLDVNNNTALEMLWCDDNQLTGLDLSNNTALIKLDCRNNKLTGLDLSKNTALTELECRNNPDLKQIFVWSTFDLVTPKNSIANIYKDGYSLFAIDSYLVTDIYSFITDANFKSFCEQYDTDKDGNLTAAEAQAVTEMKVGFKSIASLAGIEHFTGLTTLDCRNNKLTSLDVTKNTKLTTFDCAHNQLTSLDVSKNTALTHLRCATNQLTSLDVTKNTALTELRCETNQLTSLDVSNNMTYLNCDGNLLKSLDVSKNTALTELRCATNQLTSLDVTKNKALNFLLCNTNKLTSLDVKNNLELEYLECKANQLTSLDVRINTKLRGIYCGNNQLTELDVTNNTALTWLYCEINQLTNLDVSNNRALNWLYCDGNQLASLDASNNTVLTDLRCNNNNLTSLDISNNTKLAHLYCDANPDLKQIFVWEAFNLGAPTASINNIDKGDQSNFVVNFDILPRITDANFKAFCAQYDTDANGKLSIAEAQAVSEIDVNKKNIASLAGIEHFKELLTLKCRENQLETLDLTKNTKLTFVDCNANKLTSLGVSKNTELTTLNCATNQLTTLDLSKNTALTDLRCNNNNLTSLDISNNTKLAHLYCDANPDLKQIFVWEAFDLGTPTASINNIGKGDQSDFVVDIDIFSFITNANFKTYCKKFDTDANGRLSITEAQVVTTIDIRNKYIASLAGIEHFTSIVNLKCANNQLTSLDVTKNTKLTFVDCNANKLTSLNVSKNTALTSLNCYTNQLAALDVSGCEALLDLRCYNNKLTEIDLTKNTKLTQLLCDANQLTSLDLSGCLELNYFKCATNQLTSLNVSKNTKLTTLLCNANQLTSLDISANTALTELRCGTNPDLKQIFVWSAFDLVTPNNSIKTIVRDVQSLFERR